MRALTHALTQDDLADVALEYVCESTEPAAIEALVELLARPHRAALALAAVEALAAVDQPLATQALIDALDSPLARVRLAAAEGLAGRLSPRVVRRLVLRVVEDESWPVRRAAVRALASRPSWQGFLSDDPHWRVRHAVVDALLVGCTPGQRQEVLTRFQEWQGRHPRIDGLAAYVRWRWTGEPGVIPEPPALPPWPFFDPDPFVLLRRLDEMGEDGRRQHLDAMPALLSHDVPRVRALARQTLARHGHTEHLLAAVERLRDPREGAVAEVTSLFQSIDQDRIEAAARHALRLPDPSPVQLGWAIDQVGEAFPVEEEKDRCVGLFDSACFPTRAPVRLPGSIPVYGALARLGSRWPTEQALPWLQELSGHGYTDVMVEALRSLAKRGAQPAPRATPFLLASAIPAVRAAAVACAELPADLDALARDEEASVRIALADRLKSTTSPILSVLQSDPHPLVRAAALTPQRAAALVADPQQETSWHVLHAAARMAKVPAWKLDPSPLWQPPKVGVSLPEPISVTLGAPPNARPLGTDGLVVPPLGLSGHYGLSVEGFAHAVERGLNLLFWEPNYATLTDFSGRLSPSSRRQLRFLAGTFEATPQRLLADVERALRTLRIEQVALFMVFWVRGWSRITPEMRSMLERLKREGKVGTFGLSTHDRGLAVEAIADGWNPVMVRHSLAHRGAETAVFPHAVQRGTSVVTFNNTCYGRLLRPHGDRPAPTAADCYRYSLLQPGVTMTLSAPADLTQLAETLNVSEAPTLPAERLAWLFEHGAATYREETTFRRAIRAL